MKTGREGRERDDRGREVGRKGGKEGEAQMEEEGNNKATEQRTLKAK